MTLPPVRLDPWQNITAVKWGFKPSFWSVRVSHLRPDAWPSGAYIQPTAQRIETGTGPRLCPTDPFFDDVDYGTSTRLIDSFAEYENTSSGWVEIGASTFWVDLNAIRAEYPTAPRARLQLAALVEGTMGWTITSTSYGGRNLRDLTLETFLNDIHDPFQDVPVPGPANPDDITATQVFTWSGSSTGNILDFDVDIGPVYCDLQTGRVY